MTRSVERSVDDLISLFIDNELSDADRIRFSSRLDEDPKFRQRLEEFLAQEELLIASHERNVERAHSRDRLKRLERDIMSTSRVRNRYALRFSQRLKAVRLRARRLEWGAGLPVAAAMGFIIGGLLPFSSAKTSTGFSTDRSIVVGSSLHRAAEHKVSGDTLAGYTPIYTFRTDDGSVCREIQSVETRLIACRDTNETWRAKLVMYQDTTRGGDQYVAASRGGDVAFDVFVETSMLAGPLSKTEEIRLMEAGWEIQDD